MYLYPLFDLQNFALLPWNTWAKLGSLVLNAPILNTDPSELTRHLAAFATLFERNTRYAGKPSFALEKVKFRGEIINVREEIVESTPFCKLIHFIRTSKSEDVAGHITQDPKVLIVTPMSGHFSTLMRGTIEAMLPSHDVYITDWVDAKMVPLSQGHFDLEDQIALFMAWMQRLGPDVHIIAISQASLSACCAIAYLAAHNDPAQPRTMCLIGGPLDARSKAASLSEQAQTHSLSWFRTNQIQMVPAYYPAAFRRVYPGAMQLLDRMALTLDRHMTERIHYFQHLVHGDEDAAEAHEKFYDEFLSVMDVPEEFYIQLVERAFQRCDLPNGSFTWRGEKINPAAIKRTALLTVEGDLDDLSPPGQTQAAHDLCSGLPAHMKQAHLEIGVGHYGIFNGRKWRNNIQPIVHKFIRSHSLLDESAREQSV